MHRLVLVGLAVLSFFTLSACDDYIPTPPTPSPAAAGTQAPRVFTLRTDQMGGYKRNADVNITPALLSAQYQDPAVLTRLTALRYVGGDQGLYVPVQGTVQLFSTVSSQAMIFADGTGASSYVSDEDRRIDVAPSGGGTISKVAAAATNADSAVAYLSINVASDPTQPPDRAYILLARRGKVVVELFAHPADGTATAADFAALVAKQEDLLTTSPDIPATR